MAEDRMLNDEILLGLIKANSGGGGGGTTNYNQLENKPQIAGTELQGNKSLADLGIASAQSVSNITNGESINNFAGVEDALSNKQNKLTAGNYIAIENDGTIKVTQGIGVYDVYSYKIEGRSSGNQYYTNVIKSKNGVQQSSNTYYNTQATTPINIDDRFTLKYVMGEVTWHVILLTDSVEHQTGEDISWKYNVTKDFTETFNVSQDSSTDLATKGDITTALSPILDGQSIDSFSDVEIILATKQDATDNNLDTEAKTIVGAINEHEGDVSSLKSGLTDLDSEVNGDAVEYPYADVITIPDAVPSNLADCNVKIEPVQDLHGQSAPYVGGAGKNKLPLTLAKLKADNTEGTWTGNVYNYRGINYTINVDDGGNVVSIDANGISTDDWATIALRNIPIAQANYIVNGITGSSNTGFRFDVSVSGGSYITVFNDAVSLNVASDTTYDFLITVRTSGVEVSHVKVYPMIRLSTETDATFAPYTNICPISGQTEAVVSKHNENWWDEDWESGDINTTTGQPGPNSNFIRSKNYNSILPNTKYYGKKGQSGQLVVYYYDANKNYIDFALPSNSDFTTPVNCAFFKIRLSGNSYNKDVCINLYDEALNGNYYAYAGKTYTIALGDTIYGGTVDFDSGVMTVTHSIFDLGDKDWISTSIDENACFYTTISDKTYTDDAKCSHFAFSLRVSSDNTFSTMLGSATQVYVRDEAYSNPADFKTAMSGAKMSYKLATPTTIQLTPQQIQLLKGQNTLTASTGDISVTVNGVSGSIGSVQEQVNELAEEVAEIKPVDYSTTEQKTGQKWVDGKDIYIKTISLAETDFTKTNNWFWQKDIEPLITGYETIVKIFGAAIIEFDGSKHLLPFGSELYNVNNSDKCIKFANYYRNIIIKGTPYNDSDINFATKNLAIVKCNITVAYTKTNT